MAPRKKVGSSVESFVFASTGATDITVDVPTGGAVNTDVYHLTLSLYDSSNSDFGDPSGIPTGFVLIDSVKATNPGGQGCRTAVYARRWDGDEATDFPSGITISGINTSWNYRTVTCHIVADVKVTATLTDALDGTPDTNTANLGSSTIALPAVTTTVADSGAFAHVASYSNPIDGDPSGWGTPIVQADFNAGGYFVEAWQKDMVSPGSTGTATVALISEDAATAIVWAWQEESSPTAPDAPTSVVGVPGNTEVTLSWTPGADGGSAITDYDVDWATAAAPTTWLGPVSTGSTSASYVKTGLTNGTAYVFRVRAVNAIGDGAWSSSSSSVTPLAGVFDILLRSPGASFNIVVGESTVLYVLRRYNGTDWSKTSLKTYNGSWVSHPVRLFN